MRFKLIFADGHKLSGELTFPGAPPISRPARRAIAGHMEAAIKQMNAQQSKVVRRMLANVIPSIAAQLEPHLPPAAPAIRKVQTVQDGGSVTTSTTQRPAVPPPAISARQIAAQLAPYVVAERLVGEVVKAQAVREAALPVAAAVARQLTGRVAKLEARLAEANPSRLDRAAQ